MCLIFTPLDAVQNNRHSICHVKGLPFLALVRNRLYFKAEEYSTSYCSALSVVKSSAVLTINTERSKHNQLTVQVGNYSNFCSKSKQNAFI